MRQCTYLYEFCLLNSAVFRYFFNVSFSSTVVMPPRTLCQLMGPWYANACCPYDLVLTTVMLRIFGSNNEYSGLAGVYTFNSSDRYLDMQQSMQCGI